MLSLRAALLPVSTAIFSRGNGLIVPLDSACHSPVPLGAWFVCQRLVANRISNRKHPAGFVPNGPDKRLVAIKLTLGGGLPTTSEDKVVVLGPSAGG
jgi:hypothetical protein